MAAKRRQDVADDFVSRGTVKDLTKELRVTIGILIAAASLYIMHDLAFPAFRPFD